MDLNLLRTFVTVCASGSITAASRTLGLPKSSVSRQIQALEESLGVRLLHRTTRSLLPTGAGSALLERATPALGILADATREVKEHDGDPSGTVRFSAPVDIGQSVLPQIVAEFVERYPRIKLDCDFSARKVDLVAEGFDVAIRFGPMRDSSLVGRKIGTVDLVLVASPSYLQRRGTPHSLASLAQHDCLLFRAEGGELVWKLHDVNHQEEAVKVHGKICANDMVFLRALARQGIGIALLPTTIVVPYFANGTLARVLPDYTLTGGEAHILTPTARFVPHRVRLFVDFVSERLRDLAFPAIVSTWHSPALSSKRDGREAKAHVSTRALADEATARPRSARRTK